MQPAICQNCGQPQSVHQDESLRCPWTITEAGGFVQHTWLGPLYEFPKPATAEEMYELLTSQ